MTQPDNPSKPPPAAAPKPTPRDDIDPAFDRWLEQGLQNLYGAVAAEPIPEELIRLIEEHRRRKLRRPS